MKSLKGKVAVITGAGSGIGQATAEALAKQGCELAISDINERGLAETRARCESHGVRVSSARVDVADRAAMYAWADNVVADHGRVNIVINNAGVALGATIEDMSYEDLEWLMGINFWGVVYGTKAFLPHIKKTGDGHVVNISSVFGLIAVPTQSAYNAAKFAVRGFTECLREEMDMEDCGIGVTCVHPGGIKTNIARASRQRLGGSWGFEGQEQLAAQFDKLAKTTAEQAGQAIVRAILANQRKLLIGSDAVAIDAFQRLFSATYQKLIVFGARRQRTRKG